MSKVSIVYIGQKERKRESITGARLEFRQYIPVEVEEIHAAKLLRYKTVWIKAEELEEFKKAQEVKAEAKAKAAEEAAKQAAIEKEEADFTVTVGGADYDLKKMSTAKIAAMLEGAEIELEAKGAQESADDYKLRVRNSLRELGAE